MIIFYSYLLHNFFIHIFISDTANFYRALSLVGADFSLMEQIFPNRTRRELKQKFKREEKYNIDLINKVLYESQTFDELTLNDFIDQNSAVDDPVEIIEKDTAKGSFNILLALYLIWGLLISF